VPTATITGQSVNINGTISADMRLYQFFRITGVAFKLFFPEGTTPEATPL
jgi:hypothetical protein